MVLWVFDGDMVGKWTNEPCNGVDEVVNHFWVLTVAVKDREDQSAFAKDREARTDVTRLKCCYKGSSDHVL